MKKSPRAKLANKTPEVTPMPPSWVQRYGPGNLLIPSPEQLEAAMRAIPTGHVRTMDDIRDELAKAAGTTITCPLVSGIYWRVIAEAETEDPTGVPWWRLVKKGGALNEKVPGGLEGHAAALEAEGVPILRNKAGKPSAKVSRNASRCCASPGLGRR